MALYIMRHGQTNYNKSMVIQGRTDEPLNDTGRQQAKQTQELFLAEGIEFSHVFSSPLIRTRETAALVTGRQMSDVPELFDLFELDFGKYELLDFSKGVPSDFIAFSDPANYVPPEGAESFDQLYERAKSAYMYGMDLMEKEGGNVLLTSSGALIRAMFNPITGTPIEDFWKGLHIQNCAVFKIDKRGDLPETVFEGYPVEAKIKQKIL